MKKYQIGESKGFPFNLETMVLNVGDSVIPANLEENVKELHNFLFGENGFTPSKKVCDISDEITFLTGVVGNGSYDSGDVTNSYGGQDSGYSGDNGYGDGTGNGDGSVSSGDPGSNGYEDGSYNYGNGNYGSEDYGTGDGIYDPGYEDFGTGDYGTVGGDGTNTSGDYQDTYY